MTNEGSSRSEGGIFRLFQSQPDMVFSSNESQGRGDILRLVETVKVEHSIKFHSRISSRIPPFREDSAKLRYVRKVGGVR